MEFKHVDKVGNKLLTLSDVASVRFIVYMDLTEGNTYFDIYCYEKPGRKLRASVNKILQTNKFMKVKVRYHYQKIRQ